MRHILTEYPANVRYLLRNDFDSVRRYACLYSLKCSFSLSGYLDGTAYMCDICRVVYMSLWSSGQRELEGREVLVLPPHGRVG